MRVGIPGPNTTPTSRSLFSQHPVAEPAQSIRSLRCRVCERSNASLDSPASLCAFRAGTDRISILEMGDLDTCMTVDGEVCLAARMPPVQQYDRSLLHVHPTMPTNELQCSNCLSLSLRCCPAPL